jgi:nucleotide-binding universal stress UspA family protein
LDAIVGSVGRYQDFTRDFLPKKDSDEERWAKVKTAVIDMVGMPPIDVYKMGEVYFVIDGNHRVSVARELGGKTITAHVTEIETRVSLSPEDDPDEIICKARYADFVAATNVDRLRPEADLFMTFCHKYDLILAQIGLHRHILAENIGRPLTDAEAVCHWYDEIYLPVVQLIRQQGMMALFPERTEADMYVLFTERRAQLEEALGWAIEPDETISALVEQQAEKSGPVGRLLKAMAPNHLADGPQTGRWREFQLARQMDRLFADYLVALSGSEANWQMLEQLLPVAQRDGDRLLGLHVVREPADSNHVAVQQMGQRFLEQCKLAGVPAEFAVEASSGVVEAIVRRSVWADLVVLGVEHPPGERPLARLGNRFSRLVAQMPRPLLAMPVGAECPMDRVLLAYDGSPKANEALFVATYLRQRWPLSLTVLTVETDYTAAATLDKARHYLEEHGVPDATFVLRRKHITEAILETAVTYDINYLIMGGFGFRPVLHVMLGSTVDAILRSFPHPILICR